MTAFNPHLKRTKRSRPATPFMPVQRQAKRAPGIKYCVLCPSSEARPARHAHHVRPVEFGGPNHGEKAPLCAGCHDEFHRIAEAVYRGKISIELTATNPTLRYLVSEYLSQRRSFDETGVAVDARRRISASLTEEEQELAHYVKESGGFTSLEDMLKALIRQEAYRLKSGR